MLFTYDKRLFASRKDAYHMQRDVHFCVAGMIDMYFELGTCDCVACSLGTLDVYAEDKVGIM